MYDKEAIRNSLTLDIVISIMFHLGAQDYRKDASGNYLFKTMCHGGDKYKLYLFPDSLSFHCYTDCGCSYDIYGLVMKVKHCEFNEALQYVASFVNISIATRGFKSDDLAEDWKLINKYKILKSRLQPKQLPTFNVKILELFNKYSYFKWREEGITSEAMERFQIGYDATRNRIIIPHFDIEGNLIGIKGRSLQIEDVEAGYKYLPIKVNGIEYAYEQNYNLYGLDKNKETIKRMRKLMLVESEKSVMQCESFYGPQNNFCIATCNSSISTFQRQLILSLGVEEVIIGFDKEFTQEDYEQESERYVKYCDKLSKLASMFSPYLQVYILHDEMGLLELKDSPTDKGKEVLEALMKNKYEIKTKI